MTVFLATLLIAALFLAALLNLATESATRARMTGIAATIAACIGIVSYGYGFITVMGFTPISVLRALLAICRMFGGVNDLGSIQSAPLFASSAVLTIFWIGHFLAFYVTASTAIASLGGKLLRRLRTAMLKRGDLLVIYGVSSASISFARNRIRNGHYALLFIDDGCDPAQESTITAMGGVVEKRPEALEPDRSLLRHIGLRPGDRRLYAAAMHADGLRNLAWAQRLLDAMTESGIHPQQTSLVLQGCDEVQAEQLLAHDRSGYGSLYVYDEYDLAARIMVQQLPPWDTIRFDGRGKAAQDFSVVIIGFGRMGRAALDRLIMNGCFYGSRFTADIFDAHVQPGILLDSPLYTDHTLRFHECSGRSDEFYRFLKQQRDAVRYIVISTGNAQENREVARELTAWYGVPEQLPATVQVTPDSLICSAEGRIELEYRDLYSSDVLDVEKLDRPAMIINRQYCGNDRTAEESWRDCSYFSRMSCRAVADFTPALLKASGLSAKHFDPQRLEADAELLENLAHTEHIRWCAFHAVMGYRVMDAETWQARAKAYTEQVAATGHSDIRIGKDTVHRMHACLIPWEALDELSERENAVTGGCVDYKQMDRNNILVLGQVAEAES